MYLLLFLIALFLFLIYKKLSEFTNFYNGLKGDLFGRAIKENDYSIKDWLTYIHKLLRQVDKNTSLISDHFIADNPAGLKSDKYKKIENLIKVYAKQLQENQKLSEKDALIRARFEVYEFGEDKITDDIDQGFMMRGVYWKEKDRAEKQFYASKILEKDIRDFWTMSVKGVKKITPYYLMAPIYDVIVKQNYQKDQEIQYLESYDEFEDYYRFVKDRAIIANLEKIGVIKKINKDEWDGKPKWVIPNINIVELKNLIYEGGSSHDDSYFEEQFNEGKLECLFY
jgi:hypothetical protein